jgi:hypothetical protein
MYVQLIGIFSLVHIMNDSRLNYTASFQKQHNEKGCIFTRDKPISYLFQTS